MPKWMTLLEYVFTLLDPAEAERYRRLESEGLKLEQQNGPDQFRGEALKRLAPIVLAQLRSGALRARGYAALAPLHEPPSPISKGWWDGPWTLNFFESTAIENGNREIRDLLRPLRAMSRNRTGNFLPSSPAEKGHRISRIRVCLARDLEADGDDAAGDEAGEVQPAVQEVAERAQRNRSSENEATPKGAPRMILHQGSGDVQLDGRKVELTPQPFQLLLLLAKAAQTPAPYLTNRMIETHLWGDAIGGRNVRDAAKVLRDELARNASDPDATKALIKPKSKRGWRLWLSPSEIEIRE